MALPTTAVELIATVVFDLLIKHSTYTKYYYIYISDAAC
jgi:hypothetical protein